MHKLLVFVSRILFRLLIFNFFLVIMPIAGFMYLDTYEKQLLSSQEDSMVQQGRLVSIAVSQQGALHGEKITVLITRLQGRTLSRIRVVDREGRLLADSSALHPLKEEESMAEQENAGPGSPLSTRKSSTDEDLPTPPDEKSGFSEITYELVISLIRLFREIMGMPKPDLGTADYYTKDKPLLGPEVVAALEGKYGATTRYSIGGQESIIMYSAIPIRNSSSVIGAVLVSQSTYRILLNLYEVRVVVLQIFLICLVFAFGITIILSNTIARPLARLRNEAEAVMDKRGRLMRPLKASRSLDEIGDLSRALETLTERLESHIRFIESFAADLSHEFKNPLASIRSATEIAMDADDKAERKKFLLMAHQDVARMERLLSGAREITRIDVSIATEEVHDVEVNSILQHITDAARIREKNKQIALELPEKNLYMHGTEERLAQVFENILDNAVSFSPQGGCVAITLSAVDEFIEITCSDDGPGIPEEHIDRIFERFFTYRKQDTGSSLHTGLGLSIVKVIVQGYDGTISVSNKQDKGAVFTVRFPLKHKT
ncbi:MAG: HAMP domain-containing protein [Spirochaetales bacterium]|nr:HAMP domain-containing protein [Spirochaetales bacterium]